MEDKKLYRHPSYGVIRFDRIHGGNGNLFGSNIHHRDKIQLTIHKASLQRHLHNDFIMPEEVLLECEMSYHQFTQAITSMNIHEGTPVTLSYAYGERIENDTQITNKMLQYQQEYGEKLDKANKEILESIKIIQNSLNVKKNLNMSERNEIIGKLNQLSMELSANQKFLFKQFTRELDETINEAKSEVEGYIQNKLLGFKELNSNKTESINAISIGESFNNEETTEED